MPWLYLLLAGLLEVAWAIGLKHTEGWTRFWPSVLTIALMGISFLFLSLALRSIPIGTTYPIWTGIGAIGTALAGMFFFGEPKSALRLLCVLLIIAGVAGLKATANHS